jgi:hypothetical protein
MLESSSDLDSVFVVAARYIYFVFAWCGFRHRTLANCHCVLWRTFPDSRVRCSLQRTSERYFVQTDRIQRTSFLRILCVRVPGLWVHCNDSIMTACSADDVHRTQAYIIVYVRVPSKAESRKRHSTDCAAIKRARLDVNMPYDLRSRPHSYEDEQQSI